MEAQSTQTIDVREGRTATIERHADAKDATGMSHAAETLDRYFCGAKRDPSRPARVSPSWCDCVVCNEMWSTLTLAQQIAVYQRLGLA